MERYTIKDFNKDFPDDASCLEWLRGYLYPEGITCKACGKVTKHHRVTNRACFVCDNCGTQVYPMVGTIFEKSSTSLKTWFYAIFLMSQTRCGISAKQIQRETGVTYKTAWRMFHHIRTLLQENVGVFKGQAEADETYIGGARKGKRGRGAAGKTPVVGIVERKGKIAAKVVGDCKCNSLQPFINNHVDWHTKLYTDNYRGYDGLDFYVGEHETVDHDNDEWVREDVHTNTIEGFWSLMKRGISGVYHAVSPKYLQNYVNEYAFRYNHRQDETPMFQSFLGQIASKPSLSP
ncbi:Transposase zinc-ribbon domain-containing protein [Dehalogenimonas formicexedens]|uniref:Transposase zinc-ribbon domain-containing protein n=1 Tax=Dehalogenimonas formicexedens TaxID=1839801 RepID=A0A1P8F800_9CHLR|nr:IS1595 family transposase [Dehalogenimonas formicexedens]APV44606.1 Transposase zinc-ribbon domain-containing protein [Dehalogenimonas formicexedens]